MSPDQRRITELERKVKRLRANVVIGLATGVVIFPNLLKQSGLDLEPVHRMQLGVLLTVLLIVLADWLQSVRSARRDAAARAQAFIESNSELKEQP